MKLLFFFSAFLMLFFPALLFAKTLRIGVDYGIIFMENAGNQLTSTVQVSDSKTSPNTPLYTHQIIYWFNTNIPSKDYSNISIPIALTYTSYTKQGSVCATGTNAIYFKSNNPHSNNRSFQYKIQIMYNSVGRNSGEDLLCNQSGSLDANNVQYKVYVKPHPDGFYDPNTGIQCTWAPGSQKYVWCTVNFALFTYSTSPEYYPQKGVTSSIHFITATQIQY